MYQYLEGDKYRAAFGMRNAPSEYSVPQSTSGSGVISALFKATSAFVSQNLPMRAKPIKAASSSNNEASSFAARDLSALLEVPKAQIKGKNPSAKISFSSVSAYNFNTQVSTKSYITSTQIIPPKEMLGYAEHQKEMLGSAENPVETISIPHDAALRRIQPLEHDISPSDYPDTPPGFQRHITKHFVLYEEGEVSQAFIDSAQRIHGTIMLDLVEFSPWTREKKVFIFFAHSQHMYQKLSGRPAWSGGSASLNERRIYLYAGKDSYGILAHELTHMYFDSFFPPKHPSPLWLSEGMAVFIQAERAGFAPRWLIEKLRSIKNGAGYKLSDLLRIDDLEGAEEENIRLWYAQSYSFTKYLMNIKGMKTFYLFCSNIKNGFSVSEALSIAYSQNINTLEYNWRYSLASIK